MANRGYGYQYETSPRKLEPEYRETKKKKMTPKKANPSYQRNAKKTGKRKPKKKFKMSFEMKFFLNSMLFFSVIFAIIACQALVEQRYKEKEGIKKRYNELLASSNVTNELNSDVRVVASEYGMQTKSATLINLETSDYIESSVDDVEREEETIFKKIVDWFKGIF